MVFWLYSSKFFILQDWVLIKYIMQRVKDFYEKNYNCQYTYPKIPDTTEPFGWITSTGKIPYLSLQIDGPWKAILKEIQDVDHLFIPHRNDGHSKGWSSICLHGLGMHHTDAPSIYPEFKDIPENHLPYKWTKLADVCPIAADYFKNTFPYQKYSRLRFMRLEPGGYITPHHDAQSFVLSAVNISLNNPTGCNMVLENIGVVPFKDTGTVMAFNPSYEHIVWNQSNSVRYHMIVHGMWKPSWNRIVINSYPKQ